jgi:hypothetical protein
MVRSGSALTRKTAYDNPNELKRLAFPVAKRAVL